MNRLFSIIRRRPGIIDMVTPFTYGTDGYRVKWAANFDGSFATILTSNNIGYLDPNVNGNAVGVQPMGGTASNGSRNIRIVFNPTSFSIPDTSSFWLQFVQVIGGVEQTPGAPTLILPDAANHGIGFVTIHGSAPSGVASANSLQLDLPSLMQDFHMHNEHATNNLYVSSESGGPETLVPPDTGSSSGAGQFVQLRASQGTIWVRGGGSAVPFSARFTLSFPR